MSKIERFEDLIAWQKARVLVRDIYKTTLAPGFSRDFSLIDQIRRASTSILSNIAEGFGRGRRTEFHLLIFAFTQPSALLLRRSSVPFSDFFALTQSSVLLLRFCASRAASRLAVSSETCSPSFERRQRMSCAVCAHS